MPWVKLDDRFPDNEKVILAGRDARALYVVALCHSASQLTDGFIKDGLLRLLGAKAEIDDVEASARRLTESRLWERVEGGYLIHDYHDYNPTKEQVLESRRHISEERSKAGTKGAQVRWQDDSKPIANDVANELQSNSPVPVPVPVPVPESVPQSLDAGASSFSAQSNSAAIKNKKRKPKTPKLPRERDAIFDAIAEVCCVDPATAGASIGNVKVALLRAKPPYSADEVKAFGEWHNSDPFRREKGPPSLWQLKEKIGIVRNGNGKAANCPPDKFAQAEALTRKRLAEHGVT